MTKHVVATGLVAGLPPGFEFSVDKPYVACMLCGAVYQGTLDLKVPPGHEPHNSVIAKLAKYNRDDWAHTHARKEHTDTEHRQLRLSGRSYTPEAAQRLSALGIISLTDIVMDNEIASALLEAKPMPEKEVER